MKRWEKWSKAVIPLAITAVVASSPLQAMAYTGGERSVEKDYSSMVNQFKRFADENAGKSSFQKQKEQASVSETTYIVKYKEKLSPQEHRKAGSTLVKSFPKLGYDVVKVNAKSNLPQTLQAYEKMKKVSSVTPSVMYRKLGTGDPKIMDMYHIEQLEVLKAQGLVGDNSVKVAVIDSGLDQNHPELKNRIVDSVNIVDPMRQPVPDLHGTHVAGIIAAEKGNGVGGIGINPSAELLAIDVFNGDMGAFDFSVAEGIIYAVDNGAQVINMSLGSYFPSQIIEEAVNYAIASNVTVVAAAGNSASSEKEYPASYKGVISVGATDANKELAYFSSYGASVDVVAPGENIYNSAYTGKSTFMELSGTSMASPVVAGIASLLLAQNPDLTPYEVEYLLKSTAGDLGEKGYDLKYGHGLVNPVAALSANTDMIPEYGDISESDILGAAKKVSFKQGKASETGSITQPYQQHFYKVDVKEGEFVQSLIEVPEKADYELVYRFYPAGEDSAMDSFTVNYADVGQAEGHLYEAYMDGTLVIGVQDANDNADAKNKTTYTLSLDKSKELKEDGISMDNPVLVPNLPYVSNGEHYLAGEFGDQDYYEFEVEELQTVKAHVKGVPGVDTSLNVYVYEEEYDEWFMMDYSNYRGPSQGEQLIFEAMPGLKYRIEVTSMPEFFDEFFGMWFEGTGSFSSHIPYEFSLEGKVLPEDVDGFPYGLYDSEEEVIEEKITVKEYAQKRLAKKSDELTPVLEDEEYEEYDETDWLWEMARPYEIGSKEEEYIQYGDDIDLYKFEVSEDGIYHFEVEGSEEMSPFMELLEYNEMWGWSAIQYNFGMSGLEDYIQSGLKGGSKYILAVYNEQMRPSFEPYKVNSKLISKGTNDPNEVNDTEDMATILDGNVKTGSFDITNDLDMFYLEPGEQEELYAFYVDVDKKSASKDLPTDYKPTAIDPMVYIVEDTNGDQFLDEAEFGTIRVLDRGWDYEGEHGSFTRKADAGYFIVMMNYMWEMNKVPTAMYQLTAGPIDGVDEDKDSTVKNNIPSNPVALQQVGEFEWESTGYLNYVANGQDTDWYEIPSWKNSNFLIEFKVPSDIDGNIKLYDKKGALVKESSIYGQGDAEILMTVGQESGPYYLAVSSTNGDPSLKPYHLSVKTQMVPGEGHKERISGPDRYDTSLAFSNRIPDHSLDVVFLANGKNYPDALAGVVLNQVMNGTTLLVSDSDKVLQKAINEAKRLLKKDGKIIILGGNNAISSNVEKNFKNHFKVERIYGENRTKTSIEIAKKVKKNPEEIIVVSGLDFADALSIAPYASDSVTPVLLNTSKTTLTKELEDYVKQNKVKKVTVVGGKSAVTEDAVKKLKVAGVKDVVRVSGSNRYLTSVEVAKKFYPESTAVGISSGKVFPDALSGSHFASKNNMPIVLVNGSTMVNELTEYLKEAKVEQYYIYGGTNSVNANIVK
ncbi:S8 family serine peptidase [Bacillus sp. RO2]|uniref:S8 family serine peptidase n=1 Tax=Bacillus sp. RO2 TaxID=2723913 RepID=UPI00145D3668|nr:S8 family serine peptidase [Bacillus sp. RO2]NMH75183.1 S8 family serine peptidase [Bacillus sp. RO2]